MEAEKLIRPNNFMDNVEQRTRGFDYRLHELFQHAVSKNNYTDFYKNVINKISKKDNSIIQHIEYIYKLLECFKVLTPKYKDRWLLFGDNQTTQNSFLSRYKIIKDDFISKYDLDFIAIVNYMLIKSPNESSLKILNEIESHHGIHSCIDEYIKKHNIGYSEKRDILNRKNECFLSENDIIEIFLDLYASMNRLKGIIPGFNETWLLLDDGDMFENTDKLMEK